MATSHIPRRSFLGLATLGTAACAVPRPPGPSAPAALVEDKWQAFRREFTLATDRVHLAGLLFSSYPRVVREAIEHHRERLDHDPVETLEHDLETGEHTNATLDACARYLGGARDEIALTDSTTSGLALVYGGLTLRPGDEIVTTKHDHWVTHESLRLLAEQSGATLRTVAMYEQASEARKDDMVRAIEAALTPATRVLAITWVHSCTGVKTPIRAISDVVAKANATRPVAERVLLCVDGVHGFGVENVTVAELGCDVFVAGCHKWLFGPHGTGIVWARPEAWARIRPVAMPFHFGYIMAREYGTVPLPKANGSTRTPGGFRAYEHRWALREAFELHLTLGKVEVEARIHALAAQCKAGLEAIAKVKLHTPMAEDVSSGIVCFEVSGLTPDEVVARLKEKQIVASSTPYLPSYARVTPGLTNSEAELERTLAVLRTL